MPGGHGTNKRGALEVCMVVGCERLALYKTRQSKRGYCAKHRDYAHMRPDNYSKNVATQAEYIATLERE